MAYLIRLYNLNTLYVLPNVMTSILIEKFNFGKIYLLIDSSTSFIKRKLQSNNRHRKPRMINMSTSDQKVATRLCRSKSKISY